MIIVAVCTALLAKQMKPVIDDIFISRRGEMLFPIAVQIFLIFAFKGGATYVQNIAMTYTGESIIADIRKKMFSHLLKQDLSFYHQNASGLLISRFVTDVNLLHDIVNKSVAGFFSQLLTLSFLVGVMFYEDWVLAGFAFFVFPVAIMPIVKIGKRMRKTSGHIQENYAQLTAMLSEVFRGYRLVKAYCMENFEEQKAARQIKALLQANIKQTRVRAAAHPIMEIFGGVAIVIVIFYGGYQVIEGVKTSGAFFAFITALLLAYEPLKRLSNTNAELQEKLAAVARIETLLAQKPSIVDAPDAKALDFQKGHIRFESVCLSYDGAGKALDHVTLEIPAGKTVALVGASGAGKTSVLNLIPRFYDIDSGKIKIDDQDIRDVTLKSLREKMALVSQEVMLFNDTVFDNIAFGAENATRAQVEKAAKDAAAHEFISALPQGYETIVGESGVKLSGGQRQRLAIARALIRDAPILLLDEATSALDTASEKKVQEALSHLRAGKTTLVIAHRLSTVVDADLIYVMGNGRVLGGGTHEELLETCPSYQALYNSQFKGQESA